MPFSFLYEDALSVVFNLLLFIAKDVNWTKNTATDYGAPIIASDSTFNIENSQWIANQAAAAAAFQCFWNCEFDCINCTFENNISIDGFGGLIFVFTTIIMLSHVEIINRSADTSYAYYICTSVFETLFCKCFLYSNNR